MNTKTVSSDEAAAMLARGAVIAYPTETVWGIGCDATNSEAAAPRPRPSSPLSAT